MIAKLMEDTRKHLSYPLVYRLLKLALTLQVATGNVGTCFPAMNIVKNALRDKIGDDYLSHSLICFLGFCSKATIVLHIHDTTLILIHHIAQRNDD